MSKRLRNLVENTINDISSLKNEVKQLQVAVSHIEPFIKTFTPTMDMSTSNTFSDNESNLHLQILLDHLINLQFQNSSLIPKSSKDKDDKNAVSIATPTTMSSADASAAPVTPLLDLARAELT
uniref:Uncharacterized protein n=1 Tax=Trichogramma kaykai TaxID=54128 RepID=A0ABD2WI16_9HYME